MGLIGWRQPPGDFQAPLIQMLCGERARPATIDEAAKPPITVGAARKGTVFATVLIASGCRARTNRPSAGIVGSKISLFCCRCSVCHCPLRPQRQTGSLRRYHIKSDWSNCRLQQRSVFYPTKALSMTKWAGALFEPSSNPKPCMMAFNSSVIAIEPQIMMRSSSLQK